MREIKNLWVKINHKPVLTDINLSIVPGQVTALLGPNGAGKSSLLKSLCREVSIDEGQITLDGAPLKEFDPGILARSLAVLPQHASLTFPFQVHQVVAMGLYPLTVSQAQGQQIVDEQLAKLQLSALKHRSYPTLSGGEKQRVQFARVLTQLQQSEGPAVLLLDEPTSALDLAQQHRVLSLARELAHDENYAVVIVLHDLNQASRYADKLVVLERGKIVAEGAPGNTLTPAMIRQVWQYDPMVITAPDSQIPLLF